MLKYYQVFISSPSKGFNVSRNKIISEIIKQDRYFPIAMEFMTADGSTFEMLYSYMRSADVCVLILGDDAGTRIGDAVKYLTNPDMIAAVEQYAQRNKLENLEEITYTEFEYAVAQYLNVEVLAFVKESAIERCETGTADKALCRFYNSLRSKVGYNKWTDEPDSLQIINSLNRYVNLHSNLPGWIREKDSSIFKSASAVGIKNISLDGFLSREKLKCWLDEAKQLKLCYTTGRAFVVTNDDLLAEYVSNGGSIQILCCKPHSEALNDVERIEEFVYGDRATIHEEFFTVYRELKNIYNRAKQLNKGKDGVALGKIEIGFLSTLLRSSFLIVENDKNKSGWFTITLPPAKSRETVSFEIVSGEEQDRTNNLIDRSIIYFEYVWENALSRNDVIDICGDEINIYEPKGQSKNDYWLEKEKTAKGNIRKRKRNNSILIEVAAQHPLIDGLYPNEEFVARLDCAIKLFKEKTAEGYNVDIYVPGSVHLDFDGVADYCSLSEAGCKYLEDKGIPKTNLLGNEMNNKYDAERCHKGVYNTADECYVASRRFFEESDVYALLYSICSPNQLMRKMLFYIEFGIYPRVITVPTDNMFHNFFNELFCSVPHIVNEDHSYQGQNSKEARRTRKERFPGYTKTTE